MAKKQTLKKEKAKQTPVEIAAAILSKLSKLPIWVYVLVGVVVVAVCGINFVSGQPEQMEIERHITIDAPAAKIFPLLSDFHNWSTWMPWKQMDPVMKETFEGSPRGQGATYRWEGNSKVGAGSLTITEGGKNGGNFSILAIFNKPFSATDTMTILFVPAGKSTSVQWVMTGNHKFAEKFSHLFVNPEKKIAGDFEKGLEQLKAILQPGYQPPSKAENPQPVASVEAGK